MLNINDKVYLHIKELKISIDKTGFNINRLCRVEAIEPVKSTSGEEIGLYKLRSIDGEKEYQVYSNDPIWKISKAEELVPIIKDCHRYDNSLKEQFINKIYE